MGGMCFYASVSFGNVLSRHKSSCITAHVTLRNDQSCRVYIFLSMAFGTIVWNFFNFYHTLGRFIWQKITWLVCWLVLMFYYSGLLSRNICLHHDGFVDRIINCWYYLWLWAKKIFRYVTISQNIMKTTKNKH